MGAHLTAQPPKKGVLSKHAAKQIITKYALMTIARIFFEYFLNFFWRISLKTGFILLFRINKHHQQHLLLWSVKEAPIPEMTVKLVGKLPLILSISFDSLTYNSFYLTGSLLETSNKPTPTIVPSQNTDNQHLSVWRTHTSYSDKNNLLYHLDLAKMSFSE